MSGASVGGRTFSASEESSQYQQWRNRNISSSDFAQYVRKLQSDALEQIQSAAGQDATILTNRSYRNADENSLHNGGSILDHQIVMGNGRRISISSGYNVAGNLVTYASARGGGEKTVSHGYEYTTTSDVVNFALDEIRKAKRK